MPEPRLDCHVVLLPSGQVLVVGGNDGNNLTRDSAWLWSPDSTVYGYGRPVISSVPAYAAPGSTITLDGTGFIGVGESNAYPPTNFPLVQAQCGARTMFFPISNWSDTHTEATVPLDTPSGTCSLTVIVNAVPSTTSVPIAITTNDGGAADAGAPDGGEHVNEVAYWWREDACGRSHAIYVDGSSCYIRDSIDPFTTWTSPVYVGTCTDGQVEVGAQPVCTLHVNVHNGYPGTFTYMSWDGTQLGTIFTVTTDSYGGPVVLDSAEQPHFFWSNSQAYHRGRNSNLTWNAISLISSQVPSGWSPSPVLVSGTTWRAVFERAVPAPDARAQIYEATSTDNGATWSGTIEPFASFESSGWYAWDHWVYAAQQSSLRAMLLTSNKSGADDVWYSENTGGGWSDPVLWRPLDAATAVDRRGGVSNRSGGNPVLLFFSNKVDPTKYYYYFKCIGGAASAPVAWPSVAQPPTQIMSTWEVGRPPRLFWRENAAQTTWYTIALTAPGC